MSESLAKEKGKLLREWRDKHFGELEENMRVAKSIRDDPDADPKDRLDAVKKIGQMLGALASEREVGRPAKAATQDITKLTEGELAQVEAALLS